MKSSPDSSTHRSVLDAFCEVTTALDLDHAVAGAVHHESGNRDAGSSDRTSTALDISASNRTARGLAP